MENKVKDILRSAFRGDGIKIKEIVHSLLHNKIMTSLAHRKTELAKQAFSGDANGQKRK